MSQIKKLFIYRRKLVMPYVLRILSLLDVACYAMSLLFLVALVYEHGFRISQSEIAMLRNVGEFTWLLFSANLILRLLLDFSNTKQRYNPVSWLLNSLLLATLVPHLLGGWLTSPFWAAIWGTLSSHLLQTLLLALLSILQLSSITVRLLSRRANPAAILSASFFVFILIGTAMLMLPRATINGISLIDALFMSTSAICVTGLSTIDLAMNFTPMGVLFMLVLIQVGGLGVMTLTSFFAMFFMGNSSLYNQVMVSDVVSSKSLGTLFTTLLYILGFTFIIEAGGALLIFMDIHGTLSMTLNEEIWFSVFHSVSAFCNAGFSTLSENLGAASLMSGHNVFYLTITSLVVLGGVGFPILVNLYQTLKYHVINLYVRLTKPEQRATRKVHLYDLNTRIVLIMTLLLLTVGTAAIAVLEWNNGFATMPTLDKLVHSLFTAASPRTAGFSSVAISSFSVQTILLISVLMVIGGGTQSTAGGIKVNVFAVIMLNLRAIIYGQDKVAIFGRELSHDSVRRSNSTLLLYIIVLFVAIFTLSILEPEASLLAIVFESISALSTVGSSLDLTATLSDPSKVVIVVLMFLGRVGVLTMASSLIKQRKVANYKYPSGNIIIN